MKRTYWLVLAGLLGTVLSGCGSGMGTTAHSDSISAVGSGRATFSIQWPERSRLIPLAANSIKVIVRQNTAVVGQQVLPRPANGGQSSLMFDPLPIGGFTVTATAYPNANGSGTAQATATIPLAIHANQTTRFSLTMNSTIAFLELTASKTYVFVGRTLQATVTAKDGANAVVMLSPSKLQWTSSNTAVATVDDSGVVTGVSNGNVDITAIDTESGKSMKLTLLSKPVGTIAFQAPVLYSVVGAGYVMTADLDGDGKLDIAVADANTNIEVLYGNGDGSFQAPMVLTGGGNFSSGGGSQLIAADVSGDGKLDIISASTDLNVIINTGNRTFAPIVHYAAGNAPAGVTANDFNGDGRLDLAVSNNLSNDMHVYLNLGGGTFAAGVRYGAGSFPAKPISHDFNGDGKIDIALSNYVDGNVVIYFGDGAGRFTQNAGYKVGDYPARIVKGDFNNDGIMDIAAANTFSHNVSVLFGKSNGTFTVTGPYSGNTYPHMIEPTDLDGDGLLDLAMPNNGTTYFTILRNTGNGIFAAPVSFPSGGSNTRTMAVGDFNRDGKPDIVVGNENSNSICVHLNITP